MDSSLEVLSITITTTEPWRRVRLEVQAELKTIVCFVRQKL